MLKKEMYFEGVALQEKNITDALSDSIILTFIWIFAGQNNRSFLVFFSFFGYEKIQKFIWKNFWK